MNRYSNHKNGKALNWAKTDYLTEDAIYNRNYKVASINHETKVITRLPLEYQTNGFDINYRRQITKLINRVAKKLGSHVGRTGNPAPYQVDNAK
jgi:hypothetical protein|tara:strand:- start:93 stop:374 length:282 start_codon:yes stop_codon:yes gene_type:complete